MFAAILYAVYRYALEQQARHNVMERELQSGREVQQVLVPEALPAIEGYAVTSAYQPYSEVGGDFFQIIPNPDGSTMVALGDVSGHGLKAGMSVSMIVGVLRAEAGRTSPAEILGALNRCLAGRMGGGFATGMVFRVDRDGTVTFANAGHLPPYLNGQEYPLDASLPLGLIAYSDYTENKLQLQPGDQLSVYTDGVLEATNAKGELFGFDRMKALIRDPSHRAASHAGRHRLRPGRRHHGADAHPACRRRRIHHFALRASACRRARRSLDPRIQRNGKGAALDQRVFRSATAPASRY